jgi:hypothetical protein
VPTTPIGGAPYPSGADTDNVPADMQALAVWASTRVTMRFADAAARDAAITSPVAGMVAWLSTPGSLTVRTASAWRTIWAPLSWSNISLASGFTSYGGIPQSTLDGNFVVCRGAIQRTVDGGNIATATIVATLSSSYGDLDVGEYPIANQWTFHTAGRIYLNSSRQIMYVGPDVDWLSLHGLRFPIM